MKQYLVICAPVTSRSGYGSHCRDLFHSFYDLNKFEIKVIDVRWGDCPRDALNKNNENDRKIINSILKSNTLDRQPDIYVDIRIPNEFQTIGKFNIGITAGVETDAVSQVWLDGCNKMDLVIVPSEHSKYGFVNSTYDKIHQLPDGQQQKIGELKLEKPIEVLFEGVDSSIFKVTKDIPNELNETLNSIKEDFCFLQKVVLVRIEKI